METLEVNVGTLHPNTFPQVQNLDSKPTRSIHGIAMVKPK